MPSRSSPLLLVLVLAFAALGIGCTSLTYVTQAAAGQRDLIDRARDIDYLVREKRVDHRLRRLLSQVAVIKRFGERHGLRATSNYTKYTRIDHPEVVWVVTASEPLRFRPKQWSFPLVGSFTYLGWFKLEQARPFAESLRQAGWDVDVRGSGAYSTEGFFQDPVLSSMISPRADALGELADVLLHESSHATIFVHHQSTFNESVASFVGDGLTEVFLDETVGASSEEARAYRARQRESTERERVLRAVYAQLEGLYASSLPNAEKLSLKADILVRLRAALGYRRPITNATLIQYKTYNSGQEEFAELLRACGGSWPRFIRTVKRLETTHFASDQESEVGPMVRPLIAAGCAE